MLTSRQRDIVKIASIKFDHIDGLCSQGFVYVEGFPIQGFLVIKAISSYICNIFEKCSLFIHCWRRGDFKSCCCRPVCTSFRKVVLTDRYRFDTVLSHDNARIIITFQLESQQSK